MLYLYWIIVVLWFLGGMGWIAAFEVRKGLSLQNWSRAVLYLLWPFFALYAATAGAAEELVRALKGGGD